MPSWFCCVVEVILPSFESQPAILLYCQSMVKLVFMEGYFAITHCQNYSFARLYQPRQVVSALLYQSSCMVIAERLSVRHIIVRARRALMGLILRLCLYVCMYVCMYVCLSVTGLRLKYTSLRIVYVPSGTCPSCCARAHAELTIRWKT